MYTVKMGGGGGGIPSIPTPPFIPPIPIISPPPPPPPPPTPVHCEYKYSDWSECSKPCGGGSMSSKINIIKQAQHGGTPCPTETEITNVCNVQPCPVNCEGEWAEWSECSEPCGGGSRERQYNITKQPQYGGTSCPFVNKMKQRDECNKQECPVDCVGKWGVWSELKDEPGMKERVYKVVIPAVGGGKECPYTDAETQQEACDFTPCIPEDTATGAQSGDGDGDGEMDENQTLLLVSSTVSLSLCCIFFMIILMSAKR